MRIGEVSRRAGIAPSAIRYYERLGLISPPERISGRRVFSADVLDRLALLAHGRACGMRLADMQRLVAAPRGRRPVDLWKPVVVAKLRELEVLERQLALRRKRLLSTSRCQCATLEDCARALRREATAKS